VISRGREYGNIDANIAANVRAYREARGMTQEDLAGELADAGFPFTQATIWKIENGHRPVKAAELMALADALGLGLIAYMSLIRRPGLTPPRIALDQAIARAGAAWDEITAAASKYLDAQVDLALAARDARAVGLAIIRQLDTHWLECTPEEAVIEARVDAFSEERQKMERAGDRLKISAAIRAALRASGYEPEMHPEDIEVVSGMPLTEWVPEEPPGHPHASG
jgi:transcriptional regulator with XRE-family HTH domain